MRASTLVSNASGSDLIQTRTEAAAQRLTSMPWVAHATDPSTAKQSAAISPMRSRNLTRRRTSRRP